MLFLSGTGAKMKLALAVIIFGILGLQQDSKEPVPVAKEPHHHLAAENHFVRVYDVVVLPGASTLYHVHERDYFFINFGAAELKSQTQGQPEQDLNLADGDVRYTQAVLTHRIRNVGKTPFHNLTVELLQSPSLTTASDPPEKNQSVVLENSRLRAFRYLLKPGENTGMHSHPPHTLLVMAGGGSVRIESSDGNTEQRKVKSGDFMWLDSRENHSLVNTGTSALQVVEVEVK